MSWFIHPKFLSIFVTIFEIVSCLLITFKACSFMIITFLCKYMKIKNTKNVQNKLSLSVVY